MKKTKTEKQPRKLEIDIYTQNIDSLIAWNVMLLLYFSSYLFDMLVHSCVFLLLLLFKVFLIDGRCIRCHIKHHTLIAHFLYILHICIVCIISYRLNSIMYNNDSVFNEHCSYIKSK